MNFEKINWGKLIIIGFFVFLIYRVFTGLIYGDSFYIPLWFIYFLFFILLVEIIDHIEKIIDWIKRFFTS